MCKATLGFRRRPAGASAWPLLHFLSTAAFAACASSEAADLDPSAAAFAPAAAAARRATSPASYVDGRGARWELRREVTELAPELMRAPFDLDLAEPTARATWAQLSDDEALRLLRPVTLTPAGFEYAQDDATALRLVQQLRDALVRTPTQADAMPVPPGPDSAAEQGAQLDPRSRRVLSEDRFATQTFDGDGRVNMNDAATESPWAYIAALANAGQCTAFKLINNHTAVTAAHCVHDGSEWRRRKTLQFSAGAASARPELPADCYSMTVPSGWDGSDAELDFAIIRLREQGAVGGASCDYDAYNVGHFGYKIVDDCVVDVRLNLAGYPSQRDPDHAVPPGNWQYPSLFTDYRGDGWTACAGIYPGTLWFYNDGSNGQSGSPVWSYFEDSDQNRVRAIYRGSVSSVFGESNRGRRIDAPLVAWLDANAGY